LHWALSAIGVVLASALSIIAGAAARQSEFSRDHLSAGFALRSSVAGIAGTIIGAIQVFAAGLDGRYLARVRIVGRPGLEQSATAQPSEQPARMVHRRPRMAVAVADLAGFRPAWRRWCVFVFGIVLTGSRTGIAELCPAGPLGRARSQAAPLAACVAGGGAGTLMWSSGGGLAQWAHSTHHVLAAEARMGTQGDISSLALCHLEEHFVLDRAAPVVWRGLWRIQLRVVADTLSGIDPSHFSTTTHDIGWLRRHAGR